MALDRRWIGAGLVHAIHERQLAEHGGPEGVRDAGALDSALARPRTLAAYDAPAAATLATACAWGLSRNHPFVDGNKRTAWVIARLLLADNGCRLRVDDPVSVIRTMQAVAAGTLEEADLAGWFRQRLTK